jgi:hypothetical protein
VTSFEHQLVHRLHNDDMYFNPQMSPSKVMLLGEPLLVDDAMWCNVLVFPEYRVQVLHGDLELARAVAYARTVYGPKGVLSIDNLAGIGTIFSHQGDAAHVPSVPLYDLAKVAQCSDD